MGGEDGQEQLVSRPGVGSEGMGPLESIDPDCTFQQVCIPSEKARIPEEWKYLGNGPLQHQECWEMGWCGVPQGGRLRKQMGMRILWESSLCPPPTPAHMCSACMHMDGQTDTDLWSIRRRE